jgi:hypothetical protein
MQKLVLAAPQLPQHQAIDQVRSTQEGVSRAFDSTSSRTPQFLYTAPSHIKNIIVLPQQ